MQLPIVNRAAGCITGAVIADTLGYLDNWRHCQPWSADSPFAVLAIIPGLNEPVKMTGGGFAYLFLSGTLALFLCWRVAAVGSS